MDSFRSCNLKFVSIDQINQKSINLLAPYLFNKVLDKSTYSFSASVFDFPFILHQASHLSFSSD